MQKFQGGRSRYILKVPVHFRTYTIQRHRNFNLVVRVTELIVWRPYSHNADNTKIPTLKGGRSHYKRIVFLKFTKPAIQRYTNSRVDVRVTNL